MNQSQAQREEERAVFEGFLTVDPTFAGETIERWDVTESDPPDIICSTASGRTVGVEIGEWLHTEEMKAGKLREAINGQILNAIGSPQPLNTSNHFEMVILHSKDRVWIDSASGRVKFRKALLQLIADVDRFWHMEPSWNYPAGAHVRDLTRRSPLGSFLKEVQFAPGKRKWGEGINWIVTPGHVDSFGDGTMAAPLLGLLSAKIHKYQTRPMQNMCDEYVLLLFFNKGLIYNSPIRTPGRPTEMIVADASSALPENRRPFSKGYVFLDILPGKRSFRMW